MRTIRKNKIPFSEAGGSVSQNNEESTVFESTGGPGQKGEGIISAHVIITAIPERGRSVQTQPSTCLEINAACLQFDYFACVC